MEKITITAAREVNNRFDDWETIKITGKIIDVQDLDWGHHEKRKHINGGVQCVTNFLRENKLIIFEAEDGKIYELKNTKETELKTQKVLADYYIIESVK